MVLMYLFVRMLYVLKSKNIRLIWRYTCLINFLSDTVLPTFGMCYVVPIYIYLKNDSYFVCYSSGPEKAFKKLSRIHQQ